MPDIKLTFPHRLPQAEVNRRFRALVAKLKQPVVERVTHAQEAWNDHGARFRFVIDGRHQIDGSILMLPGQVQIEVTLSPLLKLAKQGEIETELRIQTLALLS